MSTSSLLSTERASFVRAENDPNWVAAHWYAVHTRSRHEKFVDQELSKRGIKTFLPLRKFARQWSDRRKIIEEPLFKGYLFIYIPLKDRLQTLSTKGVVRLVGANRATPTPLRETDLSAVKRFIDERIDIDPFPYLKEGMRVFVRSGRFKGVEGFLVRKGNHSRLVISLDMLMQSVSVEIDASNVEPVW